MSKSLMDAIRQTITEGARDKTSDGMTKDAEHFAKELHKVSDAGYKHMVQKDSETGDYEKMFSGDVDRASSNRGSYAPGEDLDKYVEYNEAVQMAEAKKAAKDKRGCSEDCECKDCESDKEEEVNEVFAVPGTPAAAAYDKALKGNAGKPALPLQAGQKMPLMRDGPDAAGRGGVRKTINPYKAPAAAAAPNLTLAVKSQGGTGRYGQPPKPATGVGGSLPPIAKPQGQPYGMKSPPAKPQGQPYGMKPPLAKPQGQPYGMKGPEAKAPVPKAKPAKPAAQAPVPAKKPGAANPQVAKPALKGNWKGAAPAPAAPQKKLPGMGTKDQVLGPRKDPKTGLNVSSATRPSKPATQSARPAKKTNPGMGTKNQVLGQSFEIDIAGTSYLVSEAHASAIAAFVEKYGAVNEAGVGEFISKEMQHPERLTARGKRKKIEQSLAIYYSKKRRGENP